MKPARLKHKPKGNSWWLLSPKTYKHLLHNNSGWIDADAVAQNGRNVEKQKLKKDISNLD